MRLFVTGGSGFIGSRFCEMAAEKGHDVHGLVRPASAGRAPADVTRHYGSLPYDVPKSQIIDADIIVHLAAITTAQRAGESQAVNEFGTDYLLKLARENRPAFIFTSTQSVHSSNTSSYAVTKRRCEEMIMESGLPWAIVRPGLVYGPGQHGLFARMRETVKKMPVMPLLGGGKALVQPIHVDDLCAAILTIIDDIPRYTPGDYNLGDPDGITLKDFLRKIATANGDSLRAINVPMAPVKLGVGVGEAMKLPLPISMDNLRGLETVERMDTVVALSKLGLELRNLDDGLRQSAAAPRPSTDDRIPFVLIGAGKIAIVHGMQIMNNAAAKFAAIVEPNAKTAKFYKSMGFDAPVFGSLDAALAAIPNIKAAVIATPADTHAAVARECLQSGLHILTEKPLSVDAGVGDEWRRMREEFPDRIIHAGYMAAQFPHLLTAYHAARMNKLGHIYKARLVAMQTHVMAAEPVRWEMLKARAGGGVMINFGCHVASMLFRLLGWPDTEARGWQWPIHSTEVEDGIAAQFSIKSTQCTLVACWSVGGFARPFNLVELECEHGTLRVENSSVYVIRDGACAMMQTQLDYDLPFNMAPDYTGGGFTLEHESFTAAVLSAENNSAPGSRSRFMPPVEMPEALRLETWIRSLYTNLETAEPSRQELLDMGISEDVAEKIIKWSGEVK